MAYSIKWNNVSARNLISAHLTWLSDEEEEEAEDEEQDVNGDDEDSECRLCGA